MYKYVTARLAELRQERAQRFRARWAPGGDLREAARKRIETRLLANHEKEMARRATREAATSRADENNRRRALAAYHAKSEVINAARRWQPTPENCRKDLFRACGKVSQLFNTRQAALERAIRRIDNKQNLLLRRHLRRRYEKAICNLDIPGSVSKAAQEILGCSLSELRVHLERQFRPGMTWARYGFYGWHIDHIRPIAKFDLADLEQRRECFHYSNLQPLWAAENFSKRARTCWSTGNKRNTETEPLRSRPCGAAPRRIDKLPV